MICSFGGAVPPRAFLRQLASCTHMLSHLFLRVFVVAAHCKIQLISGAVMQHQHVVTAALSEQSLKAFTVVRNWQPGRLDLDADVQASACELGESLSLVCGKKFLGRKLAILIVSARCDHAQVVGLQRTVPTEQWTLALDHEPIAVHVLAASRNS